MSQFDSIGHPGKYYQVKTVADGQTDYTGSNYGASAVMVITEGSAVFHLSGGGSIAASKLLVKEIYEFSISKITAASSAEIYVMKKRGI